MQITYGNLHFFSFHFYVELFILVEIWCSVLMEIRYLQQWVEEYNYLI